MYDLSALTTKHIFCPAYMKLGGSPPEMRIERSGQRVEHGDSGEFEAGGGVCL